MAGPLKARFTKRFPDGAVIQGELELPAEGPSVTVLFGPSGGGKTTVLRCLAGLECPEEGEITFGEEIWFDSARGINRTPQRRGVGLVFQDYALFPHLTAEKNIGYALAGRPDEERRRLVGEMIARFELSGLASRRPRELSGGQQQRVALARALVAHPRLLLLDEPLAALDAATREELRGTLRRLLVGSGVPVLMVTHDRSDALALGDAMVVMNAGKVRQRGPVLEVFQRPADAEIARLVRVETLQPGRIEAVEDGLATVVVGAARLCAVANGLTGGEVLVSIRGEEISLVHADGGTSGSVRNRLPGRVVSVTPGSPLVRVELDAGFPLFSLITRPACEELELRPGLAVTALIKAPAIHLIPRGA